MLLGNRAFLIKTGWNSSRFFTLKIFGEEKISYGVSRSAVLTKYFPNDQMKETEVDHVARMGKEEFNIGLGRGNLRERDGLKFRRRCERRIKMDLQYMDWIDLAQDRCKWRSVLSISMNLRFIQNAGNFLTRWETVSFSSRTLLHEVTFASLSARPNWGQYFKFSAEVFLQ